MPAGALLEPLECPKVLEEEYSEQPEQTQENSKMKSHRVMPSFPAARKV